MLGRQPLPNLLNCQRRRRITFHSIRATCRADSSLWKREVGRDLKRLINGESPRCERGKSPSIPLFQRGKSTSQPPTTRNDISFHPGCLPRPLLPLEKGGWEGFETPDKRRIAPMRARQIPLDPPFPKGEVNFAATNDPKRHFISSGLLAETTPPFGKGRLGGI